jgi:uncharacterized membrane protein YgcG
MGFTTYTCKRDGSSHIGDYTDPAGHSYEGAITDPTCEAMGYTVYTCSVCGDAYTGDYTDALGHTLSDWIVDAPATLDGAGSKHFECLVCGLILKTAVIPQLKAEDYTDNNGEAGVGGYTVIVTGKDAAPVPHARVTIDYEDNISVELPDGRLLDSGDKTTVTVLHAELRDNLSRSVPGLTITVSDINGNHAMGITDDNGQITVPASSTSTGTGGNGTIDGGEGNTYVVTVTDKDGGIIDDCVISTDGNGKINAALPDGTPFDRDTPVTVTVTDNEGRPQNGLTVTVTEAAGNSETGETNTLGKVTLPPTDRGYTNESGAVKVSGYIVVVEDTRTPVSMAFVTNTGDGQITVLLPEPYIITPDNQTTVTVLLAEDETPVRNMRVTVFDYQNRTATDVTNIHGKIIVPPKDTGYTDESGVVRVNGFVVKVEDTAAPVKGAFVRDNDGKISVLLPGTHILNADNQTTVTVLLAADETPVKNLGVTVSDAKDRSATKATDAAGKIVVPDKPPAGGGTEGGNSGGGGSSGGSGGSTGGSSGASSGGGEPVSAPAPILAPTAVPTLATHAAYVAGYPGGDFRPEASMTRAEAAAIFARLLAEKNGDEIRARYSFPDIPEGAWYAGCAAYLKNYGIVTGYPDGAFGAGNTVTRAEFTAMSVRFYAAYAGKTPDDTDGGLLKDVKAGYWAAADIRAAVASNWIMGYPDGTFRAEADITRAEVVTIVNRVTERKADRDFMDKNTSFLTRFTDLSANHWAYPDITEAATPHNIKANTAPETWQ